MATQFEIDCALMAGASYISTRPDINKFPIPAGWEKVVNPDSYLRDPDTGFEAISFTNGTELVISFAGTYPKNPNGDLFPIPPVDIAADIGLAFGTGSVQLTQAVDYYLQVKAANPGATITLTGHSLGGGLASLVGVFFGVSATTFDQAPFANSAQDPSITASLNPLNFLFGAPDIAANLKQYLQGKTFAAGTPEAVARDSMVQQIDGFLAQRANGGIPNSSLVNNIRVDGEFLSSLPIGIYDTIGNTAPADVITHGPYNDPSMDLHAQSLLTAFLQSDATAATDAAGQKHNLSEASKKLTSLLGMIFDPNLYSLDTDKEKENLLERLVRHEAGNAPLPNGGTVVADAMVTRFTADLWKLAQDGGLTMRESATYANWNNVSKALIAFAMQFYYEDTANATNASKQLFTDLSTAGAGSNGVQFDMHDVSKDVAAAMDSTDPNVKVDLAAKDASGNYVLKGYQYFQNYIETTALLSPTERTLIKSMLPVLRDWYVQAGSSGMNATDNLNRGAFMLGGTGADTLTGGTANDLLVGNAGDDVLSGGQGNDTLLGGAGVDTYVLNSGTGQGLDTILDSDNTGYLRDDTGNPIVLTGGEQYGDNRVFCGKDANGASHLYTFVTGDKTSGGDLIVDGAMLVKNYKPSTGNGMGLGFTDVAADPAGLTTLTGNASDNFIGMDVYSRDPNDSRIDAATNAAGQTWAGSSNVLGSNAGILEGGAGSDILVGGAAGGSRLYADTRIDTATAIANGNIINSGSGLKGDWLAGGAGNDTLVGSDAQDVLMGGGGSDLLIGGAGNDDILGDTGYVASSFDWTVTDSNGTRIFSPVIELPFTGGADVIYAGNGDDRVWGQQGNDVLFGEGGNDRLDGGDGNDTLMGGANNDILWGGAGSDYLDGGDGIDELQGDAGEDILIGGAGDDTLYGQEGKDTYIFNRGDGKDTVIDTKADNNIFRFGAGISASDITLRLGSLMLDLGNGDEVHIGDFDQNDVFNSSSITGFEFEDGTILTTTELLARGFDLDGTAGDDQIIGTNTTDRIHGLDGNDTLFGMDGNDTLDGGGDADAMSGGAGDDTYVVDNIGDVVTEDFNAGTDTVQSSVSFTLGANVENLTLTGANNVNGTGNELDNAITGNAANNVLDAGMGNDTLDSGLGNDVLDGGAGNDTLIGGEGQDTYRFGYGMGQDTVIDSAVSGGTLQLNGILATNLTFLKQGQDLLVQIDANDGLLIKDYYANPQAIWTIQDATNNVTTVQTLLENIASRTEIEQAESNFRIQARNSIISDYLAQGYSIQNDGTLYVHWSSNLFAYNTVNYVEASTLRFLNSGIIESFPATIQSSTQTWAPMYDGWYGAPTVQENTVSIRDVNTFNDAAVVYANTYSFVVSSGGTKWLQTSWATTPLQTWSESMGSYTRYIYDQGYSLDPNATNMGTQIGREVISTTQTHVQSAAYGTVTNILSAPGNLQTGGSFPQAVAAQSNLAQMTFDILNLTLGDAGQTVYGDARTIVHGGNGGDTIYNAGFAYGENGNDSLTYGDQLYGGAGDDILTAGKILAGGGGNDTMDGGSYGTGETRYLIDPMQTGIDLVGDTGDSEQAYKDWFYESRGVTNFQDSFYHGGTWALWYGEGGFFNSLDAVTAFFANRGETQDINALIASGDLYYVPPLPDFVRPAANDYAALQSAYDAGVIPVDTVEFAAGIALADLSLSWGQDGGRATLELNWNNGASQVRLVVPNADDPLGFGVEQVSFADGSVVGMQELIALAPPMDLYLEGTADADVLNGQWGNDTIIGLGGDDVLNGSGGNDVLNGGAGNDLLVGGSGSDTYVFEAGSGVDTIADNAGEGNTLVFGAGVDPASVTLSLGSLLIKTGNGEDAIHIRGFDPNNVQAAPVIESFQFANGTTLSYAQLLERGFDIVGTAADDVLTGTNTTDRISGGAGNDTLDGGAGNDVLTGGAGSDTYRFGSGSGQDRIVEAFDSADLGAVDKVVFAAGVTSSDLRVTRGGADNNDLNISLAGSGATLTIQGWFDPASPSTVSQFEFADGTSLDATTMADMSVNHAPTVVGMLADQSATEGQAFNFVLASNAAADSFMNDTTDTGTPVNGWMNYDSYLNGGAGNDNFSFARGNGNVYVSDWDETAGNVDAVQFAPDVLPADISVTQNQWGDVVLSINGTSDSLTLGSWLYSDASKIEQLAFADGTVWGVNDIQSRLSTAPSGGSDYIAAPNGSNTILALAGDDAVFGGADNDTLLGGAGNDWLVGGPSTGSGQASGSDVLVGGSGADELDADWNYTDTANDLLSGGIGDDGLYASISNDLLIGGEGNDEIVGDDGNDVLLFNRGDGNDWYYSDSSYGVPLAQRTDTVSLGGGIGYDDLSLEMNGYDLILNAGNGESITFDSWFAWQDNKAISTLQVVTEAMPGYDQNSADPLLNKRIQQFDFVGLANRFEAALAADPTITSWQLAPHLAEFSLGSSDSSAIGGDMAYLYGKNGSLNGLSEAELRAQLADAQFGISAQILTKTTLGTAFSDVDTLYGDSLTYSATLADGSALPAWLAFDAATQTFSGTPARADTGNLNIAVTATDTGGLSATTNFVLTVTGNEPVNVAPELARPLSDQEILEGTTYVFSVPADAFADANLAQGDVLAYSATLADGTPLPDWLIFDTATQTFSGTPGNLDAGILNVTVTATDAGGLSASGNFALNVVNVNDAPVTVAQIADQMVAQGTPLSLTIPAGMFTEQDIIHGDSLTYSASLADGTALPAWLTFDAATQTFSGTAGMGDLGVLPIKVTATDTGGLSASGYFDLTVANVINGTIYNDTLNGTAGLDYIQAIGGNDVVNAGDGNDIIEGGTGSDVLAGGADDDSFLISGTNTAYDRFQGDAGFDTILGDAGDDVVRVNYFTGTSTVEKIDGGLGVNTVAGTQYNDTIDLSGTELVNIANIEGGVGNDVITGSAGNDIIIGGVGSDVLAGGAGDDVFLIAGTDTAYDRFQGDTGYDTILGEDGDDVIRVNYFTGASTVEKIDGGLGINVVSGTQYNDTIDLSGTELVNIANIDGGIGNDVITGSADNDVFIGGAGSDVLAGGAGDDTFLIAGTDTAYDRFQGDAGYDVVLGGASDDTMRVNYFTGASTVEKIDGGLGVNIIAGTQYNDTIDLSGTELVNIANIDGGVGNDVITGSAGNDIILGDTGSDVLAGGVGDDTFLVSGSDVAYDRFQGDAGFDTILGDAGDDVVRVNYFTGTSTVEKIDGRLGVNTVAGTQYNDTIDLSGTELVNIANIEGGVGNDVITGSAGNDIIIGGTGSDVLAGGSGDDAFLISGTDTAYDRFQGDAGYDTIRGSAGDDVIRVNYFSGASTVEKIDGGLGANVISGTQYNDTIDLSATELVNIASTDGGLGNDVITGSAGNDIIIGGSGSDVLAGGSGDDAFLISGTDTAYDRFQGDAGFDIIQGGDGDDTIRVNYFSGASTAEKIDGGLGINIITGTQYNDTIDLSATELVNIANVDGRLGNDVITGSAGNDLLFGGDGSDILRDNGGNNLLDGGSGYDMLTGNAGNELFLGGVGNDTITAGNGADIIAFNRGDGQDAVNGGIGTDNTISLGGGIQYSDLALSKSGNDLILEAGNGDQINFKDWYAATDNYKSVLNLQVVADAMAGFDRASANPLLNKSIQDFDFTAIVDAFDQARGSNTTFQHWSATNSLLAAHLSASDGEALGGDLAYQYGKNGSFAGVSQAAAQEVINAVQFGSQTQALKQFAGL